MSEDMVNTPQHYADIFTAKQTQCRNIVRMLGFDPANVVKYIWRAGSKQCEDDPKQDLKKALNHLHDWKELYLDILQYHDIGNYAAARAIFYQLEVPSEDDKITYLKWCIIKEVLNDSSFAVGRSGSFTKIGILIEELDKAMCEAGYWEEPGLK